MELIYFIIGLLILTVSVGFAIKNRHSTQKWIADIMIGIFFSTLFMIFPTQWFKADAEPVMPFWYSAVSSLIYSLKTLAGRPELNQLESISFNGVLKTLYLIVNYISCILAPIITSSLLLSFFGDTLQRIRYHLRFWQKCCIFSELNENSLALAKSKRRDCDKETIVFCNTEKVDQTLIKKAREIGGILLYKPCTALLPLHKKRISYELYLISNDKENNTNVAETIIEKRKLFDDFKVDVIAFTQDRTRIKILEDLVRDSRKPKCLCFENDDNEEIEYAAEKFVRDTKIALAFFNTENTKEELEKRVKKAIDAGIKSVDEMPKLFVINGTPEQAIKNQLFKNYSPIICKKTEKKPEEKAENNAENHNKKSTIKKWHIEKGAFFCKDKLIEGEARENFRMLFVDEIALFCNSLLNRHPLYTDLCESGNKKNPTISVMIVGCGYWGKQMLKSVLNAGQIEGYNLKIRVYDKSEEFDSIDGDSEKVFYQQCPELMMSTFNDKDIEFIRTDFRTIDFYESVRQKSSDATYVCIAAGSDDLNIEISETLYRFFRRQNNFSYTPRIFASVRNDDVIKNLSKEKTSFLKERKIELFGTAELFFSKKTLFNTWLEKLALGVQLCYCGAIKSDENSEEYIDAEKEFYESEYSRRSSMATALHFGAKVLMCCKKPSVDENGRIIDNSLIKYDEAIKNADNMQILIENEHKRWNYYMATEGYQSIDRDQIKNYYKQTGNHKDVDCSKSHPCIIPFNELDALSNTYNVLAGLKGKNKKDFKNEDKKIIESLRNIVEFANKSCEEEN